MWPTSNILSRIKDGRQQGRRGHRRRGRLLEFTVTPPGSPEIGDRRLLGDRTPRLPAVVLSPDGVILTRLFLRRYVR